MKADGVTIRRSVFEAPLMNERKWGKVPEIPADVFIADMEDSVPPDLKLEARARVLELVSDPSYFGSREFLCRPNNLSTPWGRDDLEALAEAKAPFILYPKVRTVEEIETVRAILDRHGASPEIMLIVETPQAVLHLEEIASCPGVTSLMFGPGDLSFETGTSLLDGSEPFQEGFLYARSRMILVGRALGLETIDAVFLADLKDLERLREAARRSRLMGFTGMVSFYPPQVPVINEVMNPSPDEAARAGRIVEGYEEARGRGLAAVTIDGRAITVHEYRLAQRVVKVAEALGLG